MMKINAQQLSFILGIPKKDAKIKILRSLRKDGQDYKEIDHEFHPNPSVEVDIIEKYEKIPLTLALKDVKENALKSPAYKKYLLYDYPNKKIGQILDKMDVNKENEDKPVRAKTIRLPPALRSLLSEEDLEEIRLYWNSHFGMDNLILKP